MPLHPDTVRVLVHSDARFELAGFYVAQEKGYYQQVNLEVELVEVAPQRDLLPLLLAGNGDFAIASPLFLQDYARGVPLVSLMPLYQHSPDALVVQTGITSLERLAGQWVALPPSTSLGPSIMLGEQGLLPERVKLLERAPYAHEFFSAGSIAAYSVHLGRGTSQLLAEGEPFQIIQPQLYGVDLYGDCLIGLEKQMNVWLERTNRFMAATRLGYADVFLDLPEAATVVQRNLSEAVPREDLLFDAEMFLYFNTDGRLQFGEQSLRRWESVVRHFQNRGLVQGDFALEGMVVSRQVLRTAQDKHEMRLWLWVALASLSVVLFLVVFNVRLRRSVRQQTAELRESQNRLELALHSASDGVWERPDHRGDSLWLSQRVYEMLGIIAVGYTPSYSGFCSFVHQDDVMQLRLAQNTALSSDGRFEVEIRINTVRGWRWFRLRGGVQDNGKGGKRLSAVLQDTHNAHMALDALKKNEARLRQYFEVGLVGVAMLDRQGCVVHANSVLSDWLGIPEKKCLGMHWQAFTHSDDIPLEAMLFDEMLQGKRESYKLDKRMLHMPGSSVWFALVAMRGIETDSGDGNFVMTVLDISERQTAKAEQERLTGMLTLKNRTLETTLYAITHDLSKPLSRINDYMAELHDDLQRPTESFLAIENDLLILDRMLKALLKLSRLGSAQSDFRNIDMTALTNSVAQEMATQVDLAGAELCVYALPPCRGDEMQLFQAVANLIENSLRFRAPARPCSVVISGEDVGGHLEFHVRDNGVGIPSRHLQQVFTPFFRTPSPDDGSQGLGIGLAIVARIVENHGGIVRVVSEPDQWTEFTFTLPKP